VSFLPGMFPAGAAASGAAPLTLTQVLSATSTASTIAVPGGVIPGDLIVLWDASANASGAPASVVPGGFTNIVENSVGGTGGLRCIISAKIAVGTEGGTNLTGLNGSVNRPKDLYVFRGSSPLTAFLAVDPASEVTQNNPAAQVVNASGGTPPLIVIAGYYCGQTASVDPRSFSPAKDGEINATAYSYLAYKIYNTSPADVTVDQDDETGSNQLASCYIQCS
jgi:hypothetical protein